jgi:hypothetical protein
MHTKRGEHRTAAGLYKKKLLQPLEAARSFLHAGDPREAKVSALKYLHTDPPPATISQTVRDVHAALFETTERRQLALDVLRTRLQLADVLDSSFLDHVERLAKDHASMQDIGEALTVHEALDHLHSALKSMYEPAADRVVASLHKYDRVFALQCTFAASISAETEKNVRDTSSLLNADLREEQKRFRLAQGDVDVKGRSLHTIESDWQRF